MAALAATVALLGGALREPPRDAARASVIPAATIDVLAPSSRPGATATLVRELEAKVAAQPSDGRSHALLGLAYQQQARETGDPALYPLAEGALRRALELGQPRALALRGLAALAASRHRFDESLVLARRALRLEPANASVYGLIGDAELELGRYERAFAAFDRMAAIRPSAVAYARISYARELLGDTAGAIEAMQLAADAASGAREPSAWALVHLGNLYLGTGRPRRADTFFRASIARLPEYAPALAGRAGVEAARGRLAAAAQLYRRALAASAVPEYAVGLAGVLSRLHRPREAGRAYARAEQLEDRFAANGGRNQLETALLDLDRDRDVRSALARAREGRRLRPSVEGEHVLAWALYKNGRCAEAKHHSQLALRLGTKDVGALYHRSLIERCLGDVRAAARFLRRVKTIDPYFLAAAPSAKRLRL